MSYPIIILSLLLLGLAGYTFYIARKEKQHQAKLNELEQKHVEYQNEEETIHNIVHELRAPLSAVKSSAELLLGKGESLPIPERTKLLRLIEEQSKKLLTEVSSILDAAKLEAGKLTMMKIPSDLNQTIQEKLDVFAPIAENKHITLTTSYDTLPLIAFDKHYIAQVINNLVSNSLKFTPESGTITVTTKKDGTNALVSVTDTGMGIPKEKQAKLFSKYAQAGHTSASIGTGLGLYNVKGIVEAHNGVITLTSDAGKGTTMSFTIPLDTKPDLIPLPTTPQSSPQDQGLMPKPPLPPQPILKA